MSKKNTIRLTESKLKRVISESIKRVLRENNEDRRNFDSEWEFSPERDDSYQEWLDKSNSLDIDGSEDDKGEALDNLIGNDPSYGEWYDNMRKKHETNYLWRKHGEFNEHPFKDDEMDMMWNEYGLPTESYKRRGTIRLTESQLKDMITESVKKALNETGAVGAFFNRTLNGKKFNNQAGLLSQTIQKYQKLFTQYKNAIQQHNPNYVKRYQEALNMLSKFENQMRNGYDINQHTIGIWTKNMDKILQYVNAQTAYNNKQADMARQQQQQMTQRRPTYTRNDNYDTDDGISHFGNGDAWRA